MRGLVVQYADGKRPLKIGVYVVDSEFKSDFLTEIMAFVRATANDPEHLRAMETPKLYALVERLATQFCKAYSPTRLYGITKPEIRGAVYFTLDGAIKAGKWPPYYRTTKTSFVQVVNVDE